MKIAVIGYERSGSSALIDYLYDNFDAYGFYNKYSEETHLVEGVCSPMYYIDHFSARKKIDFDALAAIITGGILPYEHSAYSDEVNAFLSFSENRAHRNRNKRNFIDKQGLEVLLDQKKLFDSKDLNTKKFHEIYPLVLNNIIDSTLKFKELFIFNNERDFEYLLNNNIVDKVYIVIRNTTDMVADNRFLSLQKNYFSRIFFIIKKVIRLNKQYKDLYSKLEKDSAKVNIICFEAFIANDVYRDRIIKSIALDTRNNERKLFDEKIAKKAIGISALKFNRFEIFLTKIFLSDKYRDKILKEYQF